MDERETERLAELYARALALEKGGRRGAARAWARVLALDPADHTGAAIRLAALGAAPAPEAMPEAYVRTLFDQHAEAFDEILVARLGYGVPGAMRALAERTGDLPAARLLDLGCGTGLVGAAFADAAGYVAGLDLSEAMLELADARGVYDELYVGDAVGFLAAEDDGDGAPFDLVTAADVLPYLGPLEALFAGVARNLAPGGLWLFSTEDWDGPGPHGVKPTHRYGHAERYVRDALKAAGFAVAALEPVTVRHESGVPVAGRLVAARRAR